MVDCPSFYDMSGTVSKRSGSHAVCLHPDPLITPAPVHLTDMTASADQDAEMLPASTAPAMQLPGDTRLRGRVSLQPGFLIYNMLVSLHAAMASSSHFAVNSSCMLSQQ